MNCSKIDIPRDTNRQEKMSNLQYFICQYLIDKSEYIVDNSLSVPEDTSYKLTERLCNECNEDVFIYIGCFEGMFMLQIKEGGKPYQAPLRCIMYAFQQPFKEEL